MRNCFIYLVFFILLLSIKKNLPILVVICYFSVCRVKKKKTETNCNIVDPQSAVY